MPVRPLELDDRQDRTKCRGRCDPKHHLILLVAKFVFGVPMIGSFALLSAALLLFIVANLAVGYTFSTVAQNQLQAMQMTMFFLLPAILLSGFAFPFRGMPVWAQWLGEVLPATHFLRVVRGILLKGNGFAQIWPDTWPLILFLFIAGESGAVKVPQNPRIDRGFRASLFRTSNNDQPLLRVRDPGSPLPSRNRRIHGGANVGKCGACDRLIHCSAMCFGRCAGPSGAPLHTQLAALGSCPLFSRSTPSALSQFCPTKPCPKCLSNCLVLRRRAAGRSRRDGGLPIGLAARQAAHPGSR